MKIGITHRLFGAILTSAVISVLAMFLVMQISLDRGFRRYINEIELARLSRMALKLEELYAETGDWKQFKGDPGRWSRLVWGTMSEEGPPLPPEGIDGRIPAPGLPPSDGRFQGPDGVSPDKPLPGQVGPPLNKHLPGPPGPSPEKPFPGQGGPPSLPHEAYHFQQRVFLLDAHKELIRGPSKNPAGLELKPIRHQDQIVGYLGLLPVDRFFDERQIHFVREQRTAMMIGAGLMVVVSIGLSLLLATRLVRPIKALSLAANQMASGRFDTRVSPTSSGEIGQLARDFNAMADTIEKSHQTRLQWLADISHELRTPLAVLRGEIEALRDGVRPTTPESIDSLEGETIRLTRLVDDLYQLSLSDIGALHYRKENVDLVNLLKAATAHYQTKFLEKAITIEVEVDPAIHAKVAADPGRLEQLFINLLENSIKYTYEGGRLLIRMATSSSRVTVDFQDTPPGVPEADLARLFERFYRVEKSRSRSLGGAGLGLAICKNIVEAHGGFISAHDSPLGGVWIRLEFELVGDEK